MHAHAAAVVSGSATLVDEWFGPFVDLGGEMIVAGIAAHGIARRAREREASYRSMLRASLMRLPATSPTLLLLRASCGQGQPHRVVWRLVRGALIKNAFGLALKPLPGASTFLRMSRAVLAARTSYLTVQSLLNACEEPFVRREHTSAAHTVRAA